MNIEILSPTEIRIRAETELEHNILHAGQWRVEVQEPKPLQLYAQELLLKRDEVSK